MGPYLLSWTKMGLFLKGPSMVSSPLGLTVLLSPGWPVIERQVIETFNFSFFSITVWGIDLDYCDIKWFALEMNRDHSVVLRLHPSTAFQTLLLTVMATPFLFKGFLPIVLDIMVI